MLRLPLLYDEQCDLVSQLDAKKTEETDCGLDWFGSGYVPVSGFCGNGNEFSVFYHTPSEEASELDLGLWDNLVNYCPDTMDVKQAHTNLQEIWSKFFQKFRRRNWREARPSNKASILWTWCKDGLRTLPGALYKTEIKFYVLLNVQLRMILVNNQTDAQFFMCVYFYCLHVSASHVPVIRRITVSMRHLAYVTV